MWNETRATLDPLGGHWRTAEWSCAQLASVTGRLAHLPTYRPRHRCT